MSKHKFYYSRSINQKPHLNDLILNPISIKIKY